MENIKKKYKVATSHQKRNFIGASTKVKVSGMNMLNVKQAILIGLVWFLCLMAYQPL